MFTSIVDWNEWWSSGVVDPVLVGKERVLSTELFELLSMREIKTLTGIRRSGKSTLLYQFIHHLVEDLGIDPKRILLINFEDPVLSKHSLASIFDEYQVRIAPHEKPYLFLDEAHRCPEWELFIRKLYDLRKVEQVVITDSSSKVVRTEFAQLLTGRAINSTVAPISFRDFLTWNEIDPDQPLTHDTITVIRQHLDRYLQWGGLPEVVLTPSPIQRKILLTNYLADIVHKDIAGRYNTHYRKIKHLVDHLVANSASLFSPRKYSRVAGISLDTINTYLGHLEEVFLISQIPKFDYSLRKQQINPNKVYICDPGFVMNAGFRFSDDRGSIYELAVFNKLKRDGFEVYYWKGKCECDFVVKHGVDLVCAIQVCSDLNARTRDREIGGLVEAMDALGIEDGIIVTHTASGRERVGDHSIELIPLWRYLISDER